MEKQDSRIDFLEFIRENCLKRESHCYSRKIITSKKCDFCQKSLFFVALRCKGCRQIYHRKCARHAPTTCFVAAPRIPQGDALQSTDQLVTRDRRVPATGERVADFVARTKSPNRKSPCERSLSADVETLDDGTTKSASLLPSRSEGCVADAAGGANCITSSPCRHGVPCTDSVFYEHALFFGDELGDHSNHSSLSQGYCSLTESETGGGGGAGWHDFGGDSPAGQRPNSYSRMLAEDRRRAWSKISSVAQTLDIPSPTSPVDRTLARISVSRTGTWPTDPYCHEPQDDSEEEIEARVQEWLGVPNGPAGSNTISDAREMLKEWTVSSADFRFGECVAKGRDRALYRGQWHGEVLIHTRDNTESLESFLDEVATLSMIRHENIALFVGACIEPPHLAIITSIHKGPSLYKKIHLQCSKMSLSSKLSVARQIAQGMSYLHAKNIMVPHLSSRAVFIESKVKIDMMGDTHLADDYKRPNYACLQKGEIQYLPPETLRGAPVVPPYLMYNNAKTRASDVFAFGTILYELMAGRFPFRKECMESILYKVCKGQMPVLDCARCPQTVKSVQEQCWAMTQECRPSFSSILAKLSQNVSIVNRRHSLSEADLKGSKSRPW